LWTNLGVAMASAGMDALRTGKVGAGPLR